MTPEERLRRWRLILGGDQADGTGQSLSGGDSVIDRALEDLYGGDGQGSNDPFDPFGMQPRSPKGGLGGSQPNVARWLGDVRTYFPSTIVRVMQQDAMDRLGLRQMLLEPEMLAAVEPDIHLVSTLLTLRDVIPEQTKETARLVVRRVVEELQRRVDAPTREAVMGALSRATRNRRPRHNEIDWNRTIRANLRHFQPEYQTIVPETRVGYGRKRQALREVILCIDQSGSMAQSVIYSGIFAAVLASMPAVSTKMVVFDTAVVDLTEELSDPVDLLFGVQLGGGTDINRALAYCEGLVTRPQETIFVLISDLYDGGDSQKTVQRAAALVASGVQFITLLALSDAGAPFYDHGMAAKFAALGSPAFACTPDLFPELMAAAINREDISAWAASRDIVTSRADDEEVF